MWAATIKPNAASATEAESRGEGYEVSYFVSTAREMLWYASSRDGAYFAHALEADLSSSVRITEHARTVGSISVSSSRGCLGIDHAEFHL